MSSFKRVAFAAILSVGLVGTLAAPTPAEAGFLRDVLKSGVSGAKVALAPVKAAAKKVAAKAKGKLVQLGQ